MSLSKIQKHSLFSFLHSFPSIIILAVFIVFMTMPLFTKYQRYTNAKLNLTNTKLEYEKIHSQKEHLEHMLTITNTDLGKEQKLRHKFNLAKDGEHLLIIVGKEDKNNIPIKDGTKEINGSVWQKIFKW